MIDMPWNFKNYLNYYTNLYLWALKIITEKVNESEDGSLECIIIHNSAPSYC